MKRKIGIGVVATALSLCMSGQAALIAYYTFDDENNLGADSSGNGHALVGNASYNTNGKVGGAASLDGAGDSLKTENGSIFTPSLTIAGFFKSGEGNDGNDRLFYSTVDAAGVRIYTYGGMFRFMTRYDDNGASAYDVALATKSQDGTWQHVAMTFEALGGPDANGNYTGTIKGYVDGVLVATRTDSMYNPDSAAKFTMSQWTAGYAGLVDEVYLFDKALSESEILALIPSKTYSEWVNDYPTLGSDTNRVDNPDGDALDNLHEYALGGDPTNGADIGLSSTYRTLGISFEYVYHQRSDAASQGLVYEVLVDENLAYGSGWTNLGVTVSGTNVGAVVTDAGTFDLVTNQIPMDVGTKFIRLSIEQK